MRRDCPVCGEELKVKKQWERGKILEERRVCTHCGYEYYMYQNKVWETQHVIGGGH